jgi:hypothetical protein
MHAMSIPPLTYLNLFTGDSYEHPQASPAPIVTDQIAALLAHTGKIRVRNWFVVLQPSPPGNWAFDIIQASTGITASRCWLADEPADVDALWSSVQAAKPTMLVPVECPGTLPWLASATEIDVLLQFPLSEDELLGLGVVELGVAWALLDNQRQREIEPPSAGIDHAVDVQPDGQSIPGSGTAMPALSAGQRRPFSHEGEGARTSFDPYAAAPSEARTGTVQ